MKRIKELRTAKKLTQAELAKQLQVTQQTVAQWEKGKSMPNDSKLAELAAALDTTVAHLTEADSKIDLSKLKQEKAQNTNTDDEPKSPQYLGIQLSEDSAMKWYPISGEVCSELIETLYGDEFQTKFLIVNTMNNRTLYIHKEKIHHIETSYFTPENYEQPWDGYTGLGSEKDYEEFFKLFNELFDYGDSIENIHYRNPQSPDLADIRTEASQALLQLTDNDKFIQTFERAFNNQSNWSTIYAFLFSSNVWIKNKCIKTSYESEEYDYELYILDFQLRNTEKNAWVRLAETNTYDYCLYRLDDIHLVEVNTAFLNRSINYYKD